MMTDANRPAPVVLRRRAGGIAQRIEADKASPTAAPIRRFVLGSDAEQATPRSRLMAAAENIAETLKTGVDAIISMTRLYPEQETVFEDVVKFFRVCADHVTSDTSGHMPRGRIELPPGCGKTVVAGKIIAGSGATALYVTPRTTLAEQAEKDLREQLPNVPIGVYSGDRKELVTGGIVITTNAMMYGWLRDGDAPRQVREATVAFIDEGHLMLTSLALKVLNGIFDRHTIIIGLSGSPHYSEQKTMAHVFPYLIHRIDFPEALALNLIAKPRCGVYEVDVDGSEVRVVKGQYDPKTLERIERQAPFFQAALDLRYAAENLGTPAIVVCRTKQQAYDCQKFFLAHRPPGTPIPGVIVSGMTGAERRKVLDDLTSGKIDTVINVKVLTLGWNYPPCKIMVDLAFSMSLVDAIQKWLRITRLFKGKDGNQVEPRLYMLLPFGLEKMPVLPSDLFGMDVEADEELFLSLLARKVVRKAVVKKSPKIERRRVTPIAEVKAQVRKLMDIELKLPTLQRTNDEQIREVCLSNDAFRDGEVPARTVFRELVFDHEYFVGTGLQLMRYLRITDPVRYAQLMIRLFPYNSSRYLLRIGLASHDPDRYAEGMLRRHALKLSKDKLRRAAEAAAEEEWGCEVDVAVLEAETRRQLKRQSREDVVTGEVVQPMKERRRVTRDVERAWCMFGERDPVPTPEELVHRARMEGLVDEVLEGSSTDDDAFERKLAEAEAEVGPLEACRQELKERLQALQGQTGGAEERRAIERQLSEHWNQNYWKFSGLRLLREEREHRAGYRRMLRYAYELAESEKSIKEFMGEVIFGGESVPEKFNHNVKYFDRRQRAEFWIAEQIRVGLKPRRRAISLIPDMFWP